MSEAYGRYRRLFGSLQADVRAGGAVRRCGTHGTDGPGGRRAVSKDMIAQLLAGSLPDPDGGSTLRVATRSVVIAPSLQGQSRPISWRRWSSGAIWRSSAIRQPMGCSARASRRALGEPRASLQHRPAGTAASRRRHRRAHPHGVRDGRCAGRRRLGHDQRSLQICQRARPQAATSCSRPRRR